MEEIIEAAVERGIKRAMGARSEVLVQPSSHVAYLTVLEAAERTRLSRATIFAWLKTGKLTRYGVGRGTRVSVAELDKLMAPKEDAIAAEASAILGRRG